MKRLFAMLLVLLMLTGCAYSLDEQLPQLIDSKTLLPDLHTVIITRCSDNTSVTLTEIDELERFMMQLEGIACARKKLDDQTAVYTIRMIGTSGDKMLDVFTKEQFGLNGYLYLAARGGLDFLYLESLLNTQ